MTPFYKKALSLFTKTQEAQIQKGLAKYPEPFNPHSWTPDELLTHALEETVDLTHYLVGLKELLDKKDAQIASLHKHWSLAVDEIAKLKGIDTDQKRKGYPRDKYDINFNPHFDQDDQH